MPIIRMPDGQKVRFPDDMSKEQIRGMIASKFPDFANNQGINLTKEQKAEIQPLTDEQKKEAQQQAEQMKQGLNYQSVPFGAVEGALEGVDYGLGKIASGLTLGLSDKISPMKIEPESQAVKNIGAGLEFIGSLPTSLGIYSGVKRIPQVAKLALPVAGAIEGGLTQGIESGDIEKAGQGALFGGVTGGVLQGTGKIASKIAPEILGLTSGAGSSSIKQAYSAGQRGSKPFLESMRKGSKVADDIIQLAENDYKQLGKQNYAKYKEAMDKIGATENIKFKPIVDAYRNVIENEAGGKSYLVEPHTKKVLSDVGNMLKEFSKDNKKTLADYDDLKKAIGKINPPVEAGNAKRVQNELYNAVKGEIEKQAPVYSDIMKESQQGIEQLNELKKTFSLGRKSSGDTVLRKLQSSLRNNVNTNYGKRAELLSQLPSGQELADRISGQTLETFTPRQLESKVLGGLGAGASLGGVFNPAYLLSASPRVVGELSYLAGKGSDIAVPATLSAIYETMKGK